MSSYLEGTTYQLADALERAGYTSDDLTKLRSDVERLKMFKRVLEGEARIVLIEELAEQGEDKPSEAVPPPEPPKIIVDLDADPYVLEGWSVRPEDGGEHRQGGQFEYDPAKIALYLSERQKGGGVIKGHDLREELKSRLVFNANLLDFLLEHPDLIPEEWKGKAVCFWGTIYRNSDGYLVVRYLLWCGARWLWDIYWLDYDFGVYGPAAVPASA